MKAKEINDLTEPEVEQRLRETRERLLKMRLGRQTGQVEKTHELRVLRKDIARLATALTQKKTRAAAAAAS